ncbi:MAG: hypothetical protein NXI21_06485 [Alphaproteobacteria bacterium]|nr:hypothetical protein [Alphaproteobacteria bacterium]
MQQTLDLPDFDMTLSIVEDASVLFQQPDRPATSLVFDPARAAFTDSFVVLGHDSDGVLMHTQAVGLCDPNTSLKRHIQRSFLDYRPADYPLHALNCRLDLPDAFAFLRGRFAYQGELWMRPGRGGRQGIGLARKLTNFAMMHALRRWDYDVIWAVVSEKKIRTKFPQRSGYAHHNGPAFRWSAGDKSLEEFVVWSLAEEAPDYSNDIRCEGVGSVNTANLPSESSGTVMRL